MTESFACRHQRGVTIPEMTVAVLVGSVLAAAASAGLGYAVRDNTAINVGIQIANGYDVLNNYVATHVDALISSQGIPGVANPLNPTVTELRNLGYRTFSTQSSLAPITYKYSLSPTPAGCTPNTCNIAVYYGLSAAPQSKDGQVDMALVANIANRVGRPAGFSSLTAPGNIVGLGGAFNIANPTGPNAGIVAAYGSYGAGQFGNYVRLGDTRDVPLMGKLSVAGSVSTQGTVTAAGNINAGGELSSVGPAAIGGALSVAGGNTFVDANGNMNTMGRVLSANSIEAALGLRALNGKVYMHPSAWAGSSCADGNGTVTSDPNGQVLACQSGTWQKAASAGTNNYVSIDITNGGKFSVPPNTTRVDGWVALTWSLNTAATAEFIIRDAAGNVQATYYAGARGDFDGGSGSDWWIPVSIPLLPNSASIQMVQIHGNTS